ncbi:unnamed protein product [Fraxinus pennsylvanica]|uniref:Pentatricopeptide repeat-containing protein n=1 Tax=Fraxinus pennsylvanica TaxID=56036 RepID=A0AAD1Z813_9LAMI|nr:unnamed protein product [Fraxinus pennsylvanica]
MQPEIVEKLLLEMEATGLEPNVRSYTCLISAYGRQKKMSDMAANVFHYDICIYSCPRFQEGVLLSQVDGEKWPSSRCKSYQKLRAILDVKAKIKNRKDKSALIFLMKGSTIIVFRRFERILC